MRFFRGLVYYRIFDRYADILDWIVSEEKFQKHFFTGVNCEEEMPLWDNKNRVQAFTKAIHKLEGFSKERFFYDSKCNLTFPDKGDYQKYELPTVYMAKGDAEGRDWIRHIRNGIAHGSVELYDQNGQLYLELLEFGKTKDGNGGQTAYFIIPLSYLSDLYRIYHEKEEHWKRKAFEKGIMNRMVLSKR